MFYWTGAHRSIHVRSHSFPTRRASDLRKSRCRPASCATWPSYSGAVSSDGSRPDFSPCSSRSSAVCDRDFGDDLMTAELPADLATRLAQATDIADRSRGAELASVSTEPRNGIPADTTTTEEDQERLRLSDLEFTDLYFSETGEAFLRGAEDAGEDVGGPLSYVPTEAMLDLDELHRRVCARGQREREFFLDFDEVRYRVSKIESIKIGSASCRERVCQYV